MEYEANKFTSILLINFFVEHTGDMPESFQAMQNEFMLEDDYEQFYFNRRENIEMNSNILGEKDGFLIRLAKAEDAAGYFEQNFCPLDQEVVRLTGCKEEFTKDEVIDYLQVYQDWRRGADTEQPDPTTLGYVIDKAIKLLKEK